MLNLRGTIEFVVRCQDCGTKLEPSVHWDNWDGIVIEVPCCPECAESVYQEARREAYDELEDVEHD